MTTSTTTTPHATTYDQLLDRVITDGIAEVQEAYRDADDPDGTRHHRPKREGAIAGFEACRGKQPAEIVALYDEAHRGSRAIRRHYFQRYYELQIEWVCNVLSVGLSRPLLAHLPTYRGAMKYAEIVGVRGEGAEA